AAPFDLYLAEAANVDRENDGKLLADWTATGYKTVIPVNGAISPSPFLIGVAALATDYKVVADVNQNGIFDLNTDRVVGLCGTGLNYGTECTNIIDDDIVLWLPFDESPVNSVSGAGARANELIDANHALVIGTDTSLMAGAAGPGRSFNTSSSTTYLDVQNSLDYDGVLNFGGGSFSIVLSVKTSQTGEAPLVDKRVFGGGGIFAGYYFHLSNGKPTLQIGDGTKVATFSSPTIPSVPATGWSQVGVVVDQAAGTVVLYENGVAYGDVAGFVPTYVVDNSADLWIAARHSSAAPPDTYFSGALDEVTMYEDAIPLAEMQQIYAQAGVGICADPIMASVTSISATTVYGTNISAENPIFTTDLGSWVTIHAFFDVTNLVTTYQWFLNGVALTNGPFVIGANSNVLNYRATRLDQTGAFTLLTSNILGATLVQAGTMTVLPISASTRILDVTNFNWKYWANVSGPGAGWNQTGFSDAGWSSGPGLFGYESLSWLYPDPFRTLIDPPAQGGPITVYYRAAFVWDGATNDVNLVSTNFIEDGAVFYLNGTEVGRLRVPPNQNSSTPASPQPNPGQMEIVGFPVGSLHP